MYLVEVEAENIGVCALPQTGVKNSIGNYHNHVILTFLPEGFYFVYLSATYLLNQNHKHQ